MQGDGHGPARPAHTKFYRLGSFSYRRRWWILAVWLLALVAVFPAVNKLNDRLSQGGFEVPGSQSDRVKQDIETRFRSQYNRSDTLVLHSATLTAGDSGYQALVAKLRSSLARAPGVGTVFPPLTSTDGHTMTVQVGLTDTQNEALKHADELNDIVARASKGTGVTALLTGDAPFYSAFSKTTTHDLGRAERIALPLSLIILVIAFGSLVAAGMPLLLAIFALVISLGVISLIAGHTTVSIFTENTASMLGIGVGIDYSLFIVSRFRQRLRVGRDPHVAVAEAIASSGKAVFVSGLTVVLALSGTQLVNVAAFRSMGFGAMIAVGLAATGALTLLPAVLGMLGTRIDKVTVRRQRDATAGGWHRWSTLVMRFPVPALLISLGILLLLAAPALDLRLGSSGPNILPADSGPRAAARIVGHAFGEGQIAPVQVVVTDPRGVAEHGFPALFRAVKRLQADREVVRIDSIASIQPGQSLKQAEEFARAPLARSLVAPRVSPDGTSTLVSVVTRHNAQSPVTESFVKRVRAELPGLLPEGITADVGGDPGLNVDIDQEMTRKLLPVVGLVLLLSFFVLLLFFRSVLLPLKALLMNTASVLAAYGLMVFVFQHGHWEGILGFKSVGFIDSFLPLFQFSILFGLSMDYEVFLLARIREEYLRTGDNTEAVAWGLEHTGGLITSAAAIMVTVFGAFAFTRLLPIKELGFGLATAVFLDATLVRVVLVPATMRLLGKWNWWLPGWLDRRMPNVSLEGLREPGMAEPEAPALART